MTTISVTLESGIIHRSVSASVLSVLEAAKLAGFKDSDDDSALLFVRDPFGDEVIIQLRSAGFRVDKVDLSRSG